MITNTYPKSKLKNSKFIHHKSRLSSNPDWKFLLVVCTWLRTICHLCSVMFELCMQNLVGILDSYHIMMKLQSHPSQNADTMSIIQYIFIHFYFWIEGDYSYIGAKYSTLSFTRKSLEWTMIQCWDAQSIFFFGYLFGTFDFKQPDLAQW